MNKLSYSILAVFILAIMAVPSFADNESASATVNSVVATSTSISIINGDLTIADINAGAVSSHNVFDIQFSSNDTDGFDVTIDSTKSATNSTLCETSGGTCADSAYLIDVKYQSGTVPFTPTPSIDGVALTNASTDKMGFDTVTAATINLVYAVNLTQAQDVTLLGGTYDDILTVTINQQ